jgi:hypothetical protein
MNDTHSLEIVKKVYCGRDKELEFGKIYDVLEIDNICYVYRDKKDFLISYSDEFISIENWRISQINKIIKR